ncbi:MAG: ABC transporter ATP-binding protein, partial [Pygmaiobacter sp.]
MQADMRRDIFRHIETLPFALIDDHKTGALLSRVVNDLFEITELAHHGPEDLFVSLITLIGSFLLLSSINLPLTLIIFAFVPFLVWFVLHIRVGMLSAFARSREQTSHINAQTESSLSGIRVAKAFANADYEAEKFDRCTDAFVDARKGVYLVLAKFMSGMQLAIDLLTLIALVAAGIFVFRGQIDIGDFAAYLLYISMFTNPVRKLNQFVEMYQDGMSGFRRFCEIMDAEPEPDPIVPIVPEKFYGDIDFEGVSFNYGDDKSVLRDINVHLPKGHTVALVGPSGGGKTTFCHLIPRFYNATDGVVKVDGVDVQQIPHRLLRKNIGIVQQDVFLFAGTVRENIAYGDLDASEDAIVEAAKQAELHETIMAMPEGYNTYIGERGIKLSGGQKQRLSIARVFLKNPPILILDEATSALDTVTEQAIQQSFDKLAKGRTTLVVAHRLSTVKNADEILVLTPNGIEERGTHEELTSQGGLYATLYATQFKQH